MPVAVLDIDLHRDVGDTPVSSRYRAAVVLVRWRGTPLGQVNVPVVDERVPFTSVQAASREAFGPALRRHIADTVIFGDPVAASPPSEPSCSVIVCTRNRPEDLQRCLQSIMRCVPPPAQIIVVDNAPSDDATARVAAGLPVQYVVEPRQGLNWARTCGARVATSDLLLYTDDDVAVDAGWVGAMRGPFADPQVAAVTGLVLALELETPAQEAFERYAGFSRGFEERRFTIGNTPPAMAGKVGAGASMALRRDQVIELKLFESELDCGSAALSGGDNYAFYLLLKNGFAIVYTPNAICRHRHRRTERELLATLYGYSVGVYSFLLRCFQDHRDWGACRVALSWFVDHHLRNAIRGVLRRPDAVPLRFTTSELKGVFASFGRYRKTRRIERRSVRTGTPGGEPA
jgi:GT2 family glycosyltransferase